MNASPEQIETIKAQLASGLTLTTSNRGGWNGPDLSAAWSDHQFGDALPDRHAEKIIDFLDRQAQRRAVARTNITEWTR